MTKDVLVTISGLHYDDNIMESAEENEAIEVITPATYYFKNGKHYVLYDEVVEGIPGTIKNRIKIQEGKMLEITKSGITNSQMVFEKDKINVTQYATPYGEITVGTYTRDLRVDVSEGNIDVYVSYSLDVEREKLAECDIRMNIRAK
ncbi:DUF1934 domain-containing protein [Faecalicatena contorta]|uniref:DUF1934 domain-containing protein n=1 Tax=Faecalicatena contorta TaxID=39482 RepID=UPI001F363E02|nr:DUF1934 domain-containing protein [Faecalicatena contorta]MCF2554295.1 DUF1934 domain-containing protein [Faecalicatena contorta]